MCSYTNKKYCDPIWESIIDEIKKLLQLWKEEDIKNSIFFLIEIY